MVPRSRLSRTDRARLDAYRGAEGLVDLLDITGAETEHEAYFLAKREWSTLRNRQLHPAVSTDSLPGDCVDVGNQRYWVHGITHANTDAEREFLRRNVSQHLEGGAAVYCEQGIRPMYFDDFESVCAMDDYRWALAECERLGIKSHLPETAFEGISEDVSSLADRFREATFSLLHSGTDIYGEEFGMALGDIASDFLMSRTDFAKADDFESFAISKRAAENPRLLGELQRYYKTQFLPQPLEREWLRRHDPQLELVSHARNERMADYVAFHNDADTAHLIVGAAHQPGVVYYLQKHRDEERAIDRFEFVE